MSLALGASRGPGYGRTRTGDGPRGWGLLARTRDEAVATAGLAGRPRQANAGGGPVRRPGARQQQGLATALPGMAEPRREARRGRGWDGGVAAGGRSRGGAGDGAPGAASFGRGREGNDGGGGGELTSGRAGSMRAGSVEGGDDRRGGGRGRARRCRGGGGGRDRPAAAVARAWGRRRGGGDPERWRGG